MGLKFVIVFVAFYVLQIFGACNGFHLCTLGEWSNIKMKDFDLKLRGGENKIPFENAQSGINSQDSKNVSGKSSNGIFSWRAMNIVESVCFKLLSLVVNDFDILRVGAKVLATVFWVYLVLSTLGTAGFDTKPLLTLLSVAQLTIGFAAKDFLTDIFAGMMILFLKPFSRGNIVTVAGYKGKVLSINLRYLKLFNQADKSIVLIPLSIVYTSAVTCHDIGVNSGANISS